jgi:3-oxoacyl-[acyl-carrier protein] reductase
MISLTGKSALVTGGATGIGRAVALTLAQAGADVAVTYLSHSGDLVTDEIRKLGRYAVAFSLDATDSGEVDRVVGRAAQELGGHIDVLVNNAGGLVARKAVADMDDAHWRRVLDLNLTSTFFCTRATLPFMRDGGRIVNISSLAARTGGGPGSTAYASAKAGILGFTRGLAKELGSRGITVNAIAPGMILDSPFHATFTPAESQRATIAATPLGRAGLPADCAAAVLYLVSELGSFLTGVTIDVNGGTNFS